MATMLDRLSDHQRRSTTEARTTIPVGEAWIHPTPLFNPINFSAAWTPPFRDFERAEPSNQTANTRLPEENTAYHRFIEAIEKISEFSRLPENWDTYGGVALSHQARHAAHDFVLRLLEAKLLDAGEEIDIVPVPTGGIQFEWSGPGGDIEVEIDQNGEFHSLIEYPDGTYFTLPVHIPVGWVEVRALIQRVLS